MPIEAWGRGFDKIAAGCKEYGGALPTYDIGGAGVMVKCAACPAYLALLDASRGHHAADANATAGENGSSDIGASQSAFQSAPVALRTALKTALENTGKSADADVLEKILAVYRAMTENPRASLSAIARTVDASERSVDEYVAVLKLAKALRRKDGKRFGAWEILM